MAINPFENLLLTAYPNRERHGCPGTPRLRAIAENPPPLNDPTAVHVRECSPCFAEFRILRDAKRSQGRRTTAINLGITLAGIAAAFICFVLYSNLHKVPRPNVEIAQVDFSHDSTERGAEVAINNSAPQAIQSPTSILNITLPIGTDLGIYDVEIRAAGNLSRAIRPLQTVPLQQQGDHFPSLSYHLSTAPLTAGSYAAAWRRHGTEAWHYGLFLVGSSGVVPAS